MRLFVVDVTSKAEGIPRIILVRKTPNAYVWWHVAVGLCHVINFRDNVTNYFDIDTQRALHALCGD